MVMRVTTKRNKLLVWFHMMSSQRLKGVLKEDREIFQASLEIWEKLHSLHPDVELFTGKINYINSIIDDF